MQGYKNSIVCKEVYLPIEHDFFNGTHTPEDYKKEYGIDLNEIFNIVIEGDTISTTPKNPLTKLYSVVTKPIFSRSSVGVHEIRLVEDNKADIMFCIYEYMNDGTPRYLKVQLLDTGKLYIDEI